MKTNIIPHEHSINQQDRSSIKSHKPAVLWFTGLSGSGKSTIANAVEFTLNKEYRAHTYLLDGDNIRKHLNKDLGFSASDRSENIRRIGEVCKLMVDAGLIVLTAFISPFREDRNQVREMLAENQFHEIYTSCPLELCEQRDPKGLYKKARKGEIPQFTGISSPYEAPENPELTIHTDLNDVQQCMQKSIAYLKKSKII